MSHVNKSVFLLFIILVLAYGCGINSNPVEAEYAGANLVGKVVDSEGEPLSGVKIHYMPNFIEAINLLKPNEPKPSTPIKFSLPNEKKITLLLLRFGTRDTVAILINNELYSSGNYSVSLYNHLTSGVYIYVLIYDNLRFERKLVLQKNYSELVIAAPLITSDANGRFVLPHKVFAIGEYFIRTGADLPDSIGADVIANNISLFFVKDGYNNLTESFQVDSSSALIKTFTMQKK